MGTSRNAPFCGEIAIKPSYNIIHHISFFVACAGAGEPMKMRVRCAWNKFRELQPISTNRGASLKIKGKINRACVHSVLVYGTDSLRFGR